MIPLLRVRRPGAEPDLCVNYGRRRAVNQERIDRTVAVAGDRLLPLPSDQQRDARLCTAVTAPKVHSVLAIS